MVVVEIILLCAEMKCSHMTSCDQQMTWLFPPRHDSTQGKQSGRRLRLNEASLACDILLYYSYVRSYEAPSRNYFGFRHATMASSGVGLYHGLWWSYAHDPAHRSDPDTLVITNFTIYVEIVGLSKKGASLLRPEVAYFHIHSLGTLVTEAHDL